MNGHQNYNRKNIKKGISLKITTLLIIVSFGMSYASAQRPNVVFILADDLGWGDLGCYGNPYLETPYINQMAGEGIQFTDYYSPSPLCAPARAGILTGRYNHRTGAIDVSSNRGIDRIALSEKTMGNYFQQAGYKTALIGKWHNGLYNSEYLPHNRGFDYFFGFPNGGQDYYKWNLMHNGKYVKNTGEYLTDILTDKAISFINKNKEEPFFLFLAHHAPHPPLQAPDSLIHKYKQRLRGIHSDETAIVYAMIEAMDHAIGRLIRKLDELDLRENTIIVFTSDNGAYYFDKQHPRYEGSYSGEKGNVLEQGIRVPAIVSWKNTIGPKRILKTPIHGCDWLPTLYSLTGYDIPDNFKKPDGINILPLILNNNSPDSLDRRKLFFQKNRYTPIGHSDAAMRMGQWKLYWPGVPSTMNKENVRDGLSYIKGITTKHWEMPLDPEIPSHKDVHTPEPELYNIVQDPLELKNRAPEYLELVSAMTKDYDHWFNTVMSDWKISWEEIKRQDTEYWKNKVIPDPNDIYKGHWLWNKTDRDSSHANPLTTFKGYW